MAVGFSHRMMNKRLSTNWIIFSILALGFGEILTQLVILREFLSVFYGNELVIGLLLANWLLLSGIGSYLGKKAGKIKDKTRILILLHLAVAVILTASVFVIRNLYSFAFIRGELVGVTQIFLTAFFILIPICLVTGFSLPLFSEMFARKKSSLKIGKAYFFDSVSNIIGGVIFSFILIAYFNAFHIALLVLVVNTAAAAFISIRSRHRILSALSLTLFLGGTVLFAGIDLNLITTSQQYPMQEVLSVRESVYGKYVVTETDGQINFFMDGRPMFSTGDTQSNEEAVHYALLQHPGPKDVLMISGGVAGTTHESFKYPLESLDYIELDPVVVSNGNRFTESLRDTRLNVHIADARRFVMTSEDHYDVAIIDTSDPDTASSNRFYTTEFFAELKRVLRPDGVVGLSISSGENYLSDATLNMDAAVHNALRENFRKVLLIPGDTLHFIASDMPLSYKAYYDSPITTTYINKDYLQSRVSKEKISALQADLSTSDLVNRDFRPVAYYFHMRQWLDRFGNDYFFLMVLIAAFIVWTLWRIDAVEFAVFTAGFSGIALEILLIISFQIIYGNIYNKIGLMITAFMAGLALGAWFVNRNMHIISRKCVTIIQVSIGIYALLLPLFVMYAGPIASFLFPLVTLLLGAFVGALFPMAAKLRFKGAAQTAGSLFFYDYAGACIGAVIISAVTLPLLGTFASAVIVAVLCFAAAFFNHSA